MRIKLDYEDRLAFSGIRSAWGQYRTLVIKVGGKTFSASRTIDGRELYNQFDDQYMREIDMALVAAMEQMLTKLFTDACAAVPEGTELLPRE